MADRDSSSLFKRKVPPTLKRYLYLLPNCLTTGNLFMGFFSIIMAARERWEVAAVAILVAAFTDGLDGRLARLTKTQSSFGEQYDSMSDLVSFGAAPAFLIFQWALIPYGRIGWIACFLFLACAALRLARFNVQKQNEEKRYFLGCPSPVAASCVGAAVLFYNEFEVAASRDIYVSLIMFILALSMVSNIRYRSFKDLNFKSQRGFGYSLVIVVILLLVSRKPETYLFPVGMYYVLSAPIFALLNKVGLWRRDEDEDIDDGADPDPSDVVDL